MDWITRNKDWLITLGVFLFFVLLLYFSSLFFTGDKEDPQPVIEEEATFEVPADQTESWDSNKEEKSQDQQTVSFFLKPSPTELLEKLEGLDYQQFDKETEKLPGLRVMWPAYFFSIKELSGQNAVVVLDVSEDGFGVMLVTEIDLQTYPEILTLKRGQKIWLAAEITGVDPSGTGQFMLTTEFIRFDDYKPAATMNTKDQEAPENVSKQQDSSPPSQ